VSSATPPRTPPAKPDPARAAEAPHRPVVTVDRDAPPADDAALVRLLLVLAGRAERAEGQAGRPAAAGQGGREG
jgi:hypothetical protein